MEAHVAADEVAVLCCADESLCAGRCWKAINNYNSKDYGSLFLKEASCGGARSGG